MKTRIQNFYDLDAWKKAHRLTLEIYKITKSFPKEEIFGITSQLRRAASSVAANIAEGFDRHHFADKARFYYQSRGSAAEVQSFLLLAKDLHLIDVPICRELGVLAQETGKLINGLIRSIENRKQ